MEKLKIPEKYKTILQKFSQELQALYHDELISLALYGSAASGEFVEKHSNLNLLVVLRNAGLENLKKSAKLISKSNMINALFLTEDYIARSKDIFPIEFLDMQENYFLIYGKDVLKTIHVDTRNLRFQCEQELKAKLLKLKQAYVALNNNESALRNLLFLSFTSIMHVLRNVLRLKGKTPPYVKQDVLKEISLEFKINKETWETILAAKNKQIRLGKVDVEKLLVSFTNDLEIITNSVDKS
jgi:hypothetical protein